MNDDNNNSEPSQGAQSLVSPAVAFEPSQEAQLPMSHVVADEPSQEAQLSVSHAVAVEPSQETQPPASPAVAVEPSPSLPINRFNMRYEFMGGKRASSKLLHTLDEHQLYVLRNKYKSVHQYNCYEATCTARVYLEVHDENDVEKNVCHIKSKYTEHNHAAVQSTINEFKLVNAVKEKCGNSKSLAENIGTPGCGYIRGIFQNTLLE